MSDIGPRLDQVRELLQNKDFLAGKGLSNEVNIRIFAIILKMKWRCDTSLIKLAVKQR